jgi:DNA-directed RNA polymerase specialized sigma24 family protein
MNATMDIPRTLSAQTPTELFGELYERAFPPVALFIRKMNGSFDDAKDIFHDALVIFYEKQQEKTFVLQTSPEAYLMGIVKHLWSRKFRLNMKELATDFSETEMSIVLPEEPDVSTNRLLDFLETAGEKCMRLLHTFYYEKQPVKKIVQLFGYRNERSATVQKFKCLEKLRETVRAKSISYEDFTE